MINIKLPIKINLFKKQVIDNNKINEVEIKQKPNYVDSCISYEVLLQDSGLLPKPREDWNTFIPQVNDIAYVVNDGEYVFNGEFWIKKVEEE